MTSFITGVIGAVEDVINAERRTDANQNLGGAGSASGQFQVDLPTLQKYYSEVYSTWDRLGQRITTLQNSPYSRACFNYGEITGVAQSMDATVNSAVGPDKSMLGALQATHNALAKHLDDIKFVYLKYIEADSEHASELSGTMGGASNLQYGAVGSTGAGSANAAEHDVNLSQYR